MTATTANCKVGMMRLRNPAYRITKSCAISAHNLQGGLTFLVPSLWSCSYASFPSQSCALSLFFRKFSARMLGTESLFTFLNHLYFDYRYFNSKMFLYCALALKRKGHRTMRFSSRQITLLPKIYFLSLTDYYHEIVITFYSPSCLGQEMAKGLFGLRVKLPPAHLSTTHGGGFTLSL